MSDAENALNGDNPSGLARSGKRDEATKRQPDQEHLAVIDAHLRPLFPDSEAVNDALQRYVYMTTPGIGGRRRVPFLVWFTAFLMLVLTSVCAVAVPSKLIITLAVLQMFVSIPFVLGKIWASIAAVLLLFCCMLAVHITGPMELELMTEFHAVQILWALTLPYFMRFRENFRSLAESEDI